MSRIELEEILKVILKESIKAQNGLANARTSFDGQYYIGKNHVLNDIEREIKYQHRNIFETNP
jgi:hypothetical protein